MKKTISLILVAFLLFGMLPLQSEAAEDTIVTRPVALVEDATTVLPATEISASAAVSLSGSPYAYTDTSRFSGRTITKLGIPVKSVDTSKGTPIFTLSVVRTDTSGTTYTYVAKYPLEISVEGDPNAVNDWVYVDLTHLNLTLQENETLAFGSPTDTVSWGYLPKSIDKKYTFRSTSTQWTISNNNSIIFDVYTEETLRFAENAQGEKVATCEAPVFSGLKSILATGALSAADTVSSQTAPFAYSNSKNIFEGKKITKIGIPVKTVAAVNSSQTFTLSVVRTDSTEYVFVDQHTLKLPLAQLGKTKTVNRWIYVDVSDLNITVGANESLAFGSPSDTVKWGFTWEYPDSAYFFRSAATDWDNQYGGIFFDVYYEKTISYEDYINEQQGAAQQTQNEMLLRELLAGKTLSILGDSISTYAGYSNNIAYNSTIGSNAIYYNGTNAITDVNETWWMQTINRTAMTLNVNNSWSGDKVIERGAARALELDNNNDTAPDIIAVYLGINDSRTGVALETFTEQYTKMVQGMQEKYPNADVYLFALLYTPRVTSGVDPSDVVLYNEAIRQIAEEYGCSFVDLYHKSGIHSSNYSSYMADGDLHPNYAGMDLITQCFIDALVARLVTDHTHRYAAAVTAPTCTDRGYTTFTCICGDHYVDHYVDAAGHSYENGSCIHCSIKEWDTDSDGTLEILAIGNSFSVDALEYAYQIAQDLGIADIVIGNLYIGGCTLATHAANAAGDLAEYTYYYNDNGNWTSTSNYKISTALESRSWDYVSLQQGSPVSGVESSYNEDLTNLIAYVKERSDAKLVWHMTWAYQQNATHSAFPTYNKDQMTMYNAIVSAVQNKIVTNSDIDLIVPNGTAVQNSRTSSLGDTTTRDGYHMSNLYGRYLTGLMFIKTVTGLSVDSISYVPSGLKTEEKVIAIESVNNAAAKPFEVTQSAYVNVEPEVPDEGYILLKPELYKGAYWYSTDANRYNILITNANNSKNFFATIRFTRETLPVGSIIILEDGWQYRPEGWITDAVQSSREDNTTAPYVVVTEEWWGNYTIRGFNIAKIGTPSLTSLNAEDIQKVFRIYVPEEKHTHTYENGICTLCGSTAVVPEVPDEGYILLKPELYKGAYWYSTDENSYNILVTDANNSKNFFATIRFTRETLPIGSIIILEGGWQYRPEGWITDAVQSSREDNTTAPYLVVTEEWWGDYTIRGFNISKIGTPSLTSLDAEDIQKVFRIYVPEEKHTHTYENGNCTLCGEEQPGVTKPIISILGDSISTFSGYLPEGNATYYPATNVKKVEETWWMQLITELNAKLGVNESWSGSYVSAPSGVRVPMASVSRVQNLGSNGTPDVIFFFGGTNDLAFDRPLGSFDPATAPTQVDLEATTWDTLADGYTAAILRMRHFYPETQIIAILPTVNKTYYNNATLEKCNTVLRAICDHYDVKYVDLVAAGFTTAMLGDATHPNVLGMDLITAAAKEVYLRNEEPAAVIEVNGQTFASFEDAYAWDPSGIFKLLTDLENITVSGSLQLNLNGFTATGISAEQLFVGDSSATVNAPGTGKLITTAPVEPDVTLGATRYIALQDADGTYSFHTLELKLSAVTLRTNKAGIYYKATLSCDAALKNAITSHGIAVSILGMPTAAFEADENVAFTQLSGAPEDTFTSCSVTNIFRADLSAEKNAIRGELPIYANAYLKLENGTVLMGSNASSYSMKDVMAYLNENFDSLQPNQQTLIRDFCAQWSGAMAAWELPKLLPAPSKEEAA